MDMHLRMIAASNVWRCGKSLTLLVLVCLAFTTATTAQPAPTAPPSEQTAESRTAQQTLSRLDNGQENADVADWIDQLGTAVAAEQVSATQALIARGPRAGHLGHRAGAACSTFSLHCSYPSDRLHMGERGYTCLAQGTQGRVHALNGGGNWFGYRHLSSLHPKLEVRS